MPSLTLSLDYFSRAIDEGHFYIRTIPRRAAAAMASVYFSDAVQNVVSRGIFQQIGLRPGAQASIDVFLTVERG
jgi:hypothetical protein